MAELLDDRHAVRLTQGVSCCVACGHPTKSAEQMAAACKLCDYFPRVRLFFFLFPPSVHFGLFVVTARLNKTFDLFFRNARGVLVIYARRKRMSGGIEYRFKLTPWQVLLRRWPKHNRKMKLIGS